MSDCATAARGDWRRRLPRIGASGAHVLSQDNADPLTPQIGPTRAKRAARAGLAEGIVQVLAIQEFAGPGDNWR